MVSDYTPPPVTQATLKGAPYVTVSPVGLAQGLPRNNNANYGPDTPGTTTCGINEAVNSGATSIVLLKIPGKVFQTSTSIMLPAAYGVRLVAEGPMDFNGEPGLAYINYSGTGYAIDTAASPALNIKGYIDGIHVETPNGSGVHFNGVVYDIGYLGAVGGGVAGSIGLNFDSLSNAVEAHIKNLRVGGYLLHVRINQDHFTCDHLNTSYTYAGQTIIDHVAGWGFHIGYWHNFCNNVAAANGLTIEAGYAMKIDVLLWEPDTWTTPTTSIISNSSSETIRLGPISTTNAFDPATYMTGSNYTFFENLKTGNFLLANAIMFGKFGHYNSVATAGNGLVSILGLDNRRGLTAVDAAAITLYTVPAVTTTAFKVNLRALLTAGTTPSASYVVAWTEGGVVQSVTVTVSALNTPSTQPGILIQPDESTAITAQLTAISGTGTTVNVAADVEEIA